MLPENNWRKQDLIESRDEPPQRNGPQEQISDDYQNLEFSADSMLSMDVENVEGAEEMPENSLSLELVE